MTEDDHDPYLYLLSRQIPSDNVVYGFVISRAETKFYNEPFGSYFLLFSIDTYIFHSVFHFGINIIINGEKEKQICFLDAVRIVNKQFINTDIPALDHLKTSPIPDVGR